MHTNLLYGFLSNREVEKTSILKVSNFFAILMSEVADNHYHQNMTSNYKDVHEFPNLKKYVVLYTLL
jgi:hypothetical protein